MKLGNWYIYCDICGRRILASEATKLEDYTGRGGSIVCKYDVDVRDDGLVPYKVSLSKNIPWTRINHTNTDDGSPLVDLETMTYQYFLAASQDSAILTASQDDAWIIASEPV